MMSLKCHFPQTNRLSVKNYDIGDSMENLLCGMVPDFHKEDIF